MIKILGITVFFSLMIAGIESQVTGDWVTDSGHDYYVSSLLEETQRTWHAARILCQQNGGELASIHSETEKAFIGSLTFAGEYAGGLWNGLNDLDDWQNTWKWSDGTGVHSVDYWAPDQPNLQNTGEYCAFQFAKESDGSAPNGLWYNAHCDARKGFICKRQTGFTDPVSPPPTPVIGGYCPHTYYGVGNKCFKPHHRSVENGATWEEALFECTLGPGINPSLASVQTQQEAAAIASFQQGLEAGLWIGLQRVDAEAGFRWVDNSPYFFTNWAPNEPGTEEHCGEVWEFPIGSWNDVNCDSKRGFVCQTWKDPSNLISTPNPTTFPCPSGFFSYYYSCYKVINSPKTWSAAETDCKGQGSSLLVTSHDGAENAAIQVMSAQLGSPIWIGLRDEDGDGSYEWIDNWPVIYTNWGLNEPAPDTGGGCITLHIDGTWQDDHCSDSYPYICKYTDAEPRSTPPYVEGECPDTTWVEHGSYCYFFQTSSIETKNWLDADRDCFSRSEHSALASIHDSAENDFVLSYMADVNVNAHAWIGMYRSKNDDAFRWADFSAIQYTNWGVGEPNGNAHDAGCVRMYTSSNEGGVWDDHGCDVYNQYVCKMPKLPPVTTPVPGPGICPGIWSPLGNYCYHFEPDSFGTWTQSQDRCKSHHPTANLVTIESQGENDWIVQKMKDSNTLPGDNNFWTGYIKDGALPNFYWYDGTEKSYENWAVSEPNDDTGYEKCTEVLTVLGTWNDVPCDAAIGYACRMPKCAESDSACINGENVGDSENKGHSLSAKYASTFMMMFVCVVAKVIQL